MFRAMIFDMDGTLVDSEKLHYEAWKATLKNFGVDSFPFENFLNYVGASNEKLASDYIRSHKLSSNCQEMTRAKQNTYLRMIPDIEILPGVRKLLDRYHGRFSLAIASSSDTIELHAILETLQLTDIFDHVVGGNDVMRKKPAPDIYLHTRDLLGVESAECIVFEDSEPGIAAAKAAGMIGIAVPNALVATMDFSKADTIIDRIDQADDKLIADLCKY